MSHRVQGIELGALESKARLAFQAMQAEYRVNFDLRSLAIVIKSLGVINLETGEQLRGLINDSGCAKSTRV